MIFREDCNRIHLRLNILFKVRKEKKEKRKKKGKRKKKRKKRNARKKRRKTFFLWWRKEAYQVHSGGHGISFVVSIYNYLLHLTIANPNRACTTVHKGTNLNYIRQKYLKRKKGNRNTTERKREGKRTKKRKEN